MNQYNRIPSDPRYACYDNPLAQTHSRIHGSLRFLGSWYGTVTMRYVGFAVTVTVAVAVSISDPVVDRVWRYCLRYQYREFEVLGGSLTSEYLGFTLAKARR